MKYIWVQACYTVAMEIREAAKSAAKDLGYPDPKQEQSDFVETFVKGRNVFAVLPTGFGKSSCFACLPIMKDQVSEFY